MNRRGFFARLGALIFAPKLPVAKPSPKLTFSTATYLPKKPIVYPITLCCWVKPGESVVWDVSGNERRVASERNHSS